MEWLRDSDSSSNQWDCDWCKAKGIQKVRNCQGKFDSPSNIKVFDEIYVSCPVNVLWDHEICDLLNIVEACEPQGMGAGRYSPALYLEETNYFHILHRIILNEKGRIDRWKEKNKKKE